MTDRYLEADNPSQGWLAAVELMHGVPGRKAVHLVIRIRDAASEDEDIRAEAQRLIDANNRRSRQELPDVLTTRNTIFPAAWAARIPDPEDLAEYYRQRYTRDGLRGFRGNERGTYFGRLVAYPRADGETSDQLSNTVRKIRAELATPGPKSSRYELNVYCERKDQSPMSFPCLAHVSMHLHEDHLHMQAIYRNEHLVARGYGNFLGLAQLQCYVANATGTTPGELLLTLGHVELDQRVTPVNGLLSRFSASN